MPLNVQVSRYIDAIRKQLGVQGHTGLNLVDDCLPVWPMYDDRPESFQLREEFRFSLPTSQPAVAAQYGRLHFSAGAPAGASRNRIVVIDTIRSRNTDLIYGWDSLGGAAALTIDSRLDRRNTGVLPSLLATADTNAADSLVQALGQAQAGFEVRLGLVMLAGQTPFGVRTWAVNQQLDFTITWREFTPGDEEMRG